MRIQKQNDRINLRSDPQVKSSLEIAAFLAGYASLKAFMMETAEEKAKEILENLEQKPLSDRDRDLLLKLLDKSPEPNGALKKAFTKVNASYKTIGDIIVHQVERNFFKKVKRERSATK